MKKLTEEQEKTLRQEWKTPSIFMSAVESEFGKITIDVAASSRNKRCERYFSKKDNALDFGLAWGDGTDIAWLNPGFAKLGIWMRRAYFESQKHTCKLILVMALCSPASLWHNTWARRAREILLLAPRVPFIAPKGIKQSTNARENCLVVFDQHDYEKTRRTAQIHTWMWKRINRINDHDYRYVMDAFDNRATSPIKSLLRKNKNLT